VTSKEVLAEAEADANLTIREEFPRNALNAHDPRRCGRCVERRSPEILPLTRRIMPLQLRA
jgi:hypothetical protein